MGAFGVQVKDLFHALLRENTMAATADAFLETQPEQQLTQVRERDVGVGFGK